MTDPDEHRPPDEPVDILLVEDNPGDVRLVTEAFEATTRAPTIHTVTTANAAVDFLKGQCAAESRSLPALALVDLNLPGSDGCAVLEAVSNDPQLRRLPVIILTSSEASEDITRCYDARANAYLSKPAVYAEYVSVVKVVKTFWLEQVQLPPLES